MARFCLQIAGYTGEVVSLFESTRDYCRNYLSLEAPDFRFTVTKDHLAFEQAAAQAEAQALGFKPRIFTDPFLERAAVQRAFAEFLLDKNVLLLHGSALALDGDGYLFTAKSGTGKSTHCRLWRQVFGERVRPVNDDKPFLTILDRGVTVHGAPWSGKHGLDTNLDVPLRGIFLLERGKEDRICPLSPARISPALLEAAHHPLEARREPLLQGLAETLAHTVPAWRLICTPTPNAVLTAHSVLSER